MKRGLTMPENEKRIFPWKYIYLVIILTIYTLGCFYFNERANGIETIYQKAGPVIAVSTQLQTENNNVIDQAKTAEVINTNMNNPDTKLLIEFLNQFKEYNEMLNNTLSKTLKFFLYIIGLFALIFGYFGLKTQQDIKNNAKDEVAKMSALYANNFDLLKDQSILSNNLFKICNQVYEVQYRDVQNTIEADRTQIELISKDIYQKQIDMEKLQSDINITYFKLQKLSELYGVIESKRDEERSEKDDKTEQTQSIVANKVFDAQDEFDEE